MARSESVKRALASLATEPRYRSTVEEATAAVGDLAAAARFVDEGGLRRLRRARATAHRRGDADAVASADRALAVFERFRAAADYHFRPARGTFLPRAGKGIEE